MNEMANQVTCSFIIRPNGWDERKFQIISESNDSSLGGSSLSVSSGKMNLKRLVIITSAWSNHWWKSTRHQGRRRTQSFQFTYRKWLSINKMEFGHLDRTFLRTSLLSRTELYPNTSFSSFSPSHLAPPHFDGHINLQWQCRHESEEKGQMTIEPIISHLTPHTSHKYGSREKCCSSIAQAPTSGRYICSALVISIHYNKATWRRQSWENAS